MFTMLGKHDYVFKLFNIETTNLKKMLVFCLIEQIQLTCIGLTCELHPLG
jgi:hypothetical protein